MAALLLNKNPFLTPAQIQTALTSTADPIGTPTVDIAGTGRLDALAALAAANAVPAPQCLTDSACNDGNPCNGVETCRSGVCAAGTPLNCDDANPCTTDACDPTTGCQHRPSADGITCSDGNICMVGDTCNSGVCQPGTSATPGDLSELVIGRVGAATSACINIGDRAKVWTKISLPLEKASWMLYQANSASG